MPVLMLNPGRGGGGARGLRARMIRLRPWLFIAMIVAIISTPMRDVVRGWFPELFGPAKDQAALDAEQIVELARAGRSYAIDVLRVVDGDTVVARVHLDDATAIVTRIRLRTIDAPELNGACNSEIELARKARDRLQALLKGDTLQASNIAADKYAGRIDADLTATRGGDVAAQLVRDGLARPYDGGRRKSWCN